MGGDACRLLATIFLVRLGQGSGHLTGVNRENRDSRDSATAFPLFGSVEFCGHNFFLNFPQLFLFISSGESNSTELR